MTAADKIAAASAFLDEARRARRPVDAPPSELAPADEAEAWAIHQAVVAKRGVVAGWKVGASSPTAEPGVGQIGRDTLFPSPHRFPADAFRLWAVEAEIAVTFARDMPARDEPYSREETLAAVDSWHAAIEVLDTAFADWGAASPLWKLADRQSHGALVVGLPHALPPDADLVNLRVRLLIDGAPVFDHAGGNSAGDPVRLLVALANRQRSTDRPLMAGDVVTTGSTNPFYQAKAGQAVRAEFDCLGSAELAIER